MNKIKMAERLFSQITKLEKQIPLLEKKIRKITEEVAKNYPVVRRYFAAPQHVRNYREYFVIGLPEDINLKDAYIDTNTSLLFINGKVYEGDWSLAETPEELLSELVRRQKNIKGGKKK